MGRKSRYSAEVRERAVRMVFEHQDEHASQWAAIGSIATKIGCSTETLRHWVRQVERDTGRRPGLATDERQRLKDLEREVRELRRQRDPEESVGFFRPDGTRPSTEVMVDFVDEHRSTYGVEPISGVLPITPSTYYEQEARRRNPDLLPARAKRDAELRDEIERVWRENFSSAKGLLELLQRAPAWIGGPGSTKTASSRSTARRPWTPPALPFGAGR